MSEWLVSPTDGVVDNGNGVFTFSANNYTWDKTYTITYTDDYGCSNSITYTVPACNVTLTLHKVYGIAVGDSVSMWCENAETNFNGLCTFHVVDYKKNPIYYGLFSIYFEGGKVSSIDGIGTEIDVPPEVGDLYALVEWEQEEGDRNWYILDNQRIGVDIRNNRLSIMVFIRCQNE